MKDFEKGLRCQDVHAGLSNVDPNSAALSSLVDTRIIGMAASLASAIRGQDVIRDAQVLMKVAADQLDVDSLAFNQVVEVLDEAGFVHSVSKKAGKIRSFSEQVPFHSNLYETLGEMWDDRAPTETEQQLLTTVNRLAQTPVPEDELANEAGIEKASFQEVMAIATESDLVKVVETADGRVLYSPFLGFENPELLSDVMTKYGSDQMQEEFAAVRSYQGLPVKEAEYPALSDAISRGLIIAPSVQRPDRVDQPFACIPYAIDTELFTVRKAILDKALAVLACVRCGQHFGGATAIRTPARILNALLDASRDYSLSPHSSARRQYQLLFRMQVMDFEPSGNWVQPRLIPTEDNIAAVELARDLLLYGETLTDRQGDEKYASQLLLTEAPYHSPLETVHRRRGRVRLKDKEYAKAMDVLMGRSAL